MIFAIAAIFFAIAALITPYIIYVLGAKSVGEVIIIYDVVAHGCFYVLSIGSLICGIISNARRERSPLCIIAILGGPLAFIVWAFVYPALVQK